MGLRQNLFTSIHVGFHKILVPIFVLIFLTSCTKGEPSFKDLFSSFLAGPTFSDTGSTETERLFLNTSAAFTVSGTCSTSIEDLEWSIDSGNEYKKVSDQSDASSDTDCSDGTFNIVVNPASSLLSISSVGDEQEILLRGSASTINTDDSKIIAKYVAPAILIINNGATFDYGNVARTSTKTKTISIENTGGYHAISPVDFGIGLGGTFDYSGAGATYPGTNGTCNQASIYPGESCLVEIEFTPDVTGTHTDSFGIQYFDGNVTVSVIGQLSAESINAAILSFLPIAPFDYTQVVQGVTLSHTFTISNSGGMTATIPSMVSSHSDFDISRDACTSLSPTSTCEFDVDFVPTIDGLYNDSISVTFNNGVGTQVSNYEVIGEGESPALMVSAQASYDFGARTQSSTSTYVFTISNTGDTFATGFAISNSYDTDWGVTSGCVGVSSGGVCLVTLTYEPNALSSDSISINLGYVDGAGNTPFIPLQATGVGVTPADLNYLPASPYSPGSPVIGTTTTYTFTLSNSGETTATSMNPTLGPNVSAFTQDTLCNSDLAAGATCVFTVSFTPSAQATVTEELQTGFNNGLYINQTSNFTMTGGGTPTANLVYSEATYNFGQRVRFSTDFHSFTISNSGGGGWAATSMSVNLIVDGTSLDIDPGDCNSGLNDESTCVFEVTFTPNLIATYADSVHISYNNGANIINNYIPIDGEGVTPANLSSLPPTYDFGDVASGSTAVRIYTITNSGTTTASSISLVDTTMEAGMSSTNSCSSTLLTTGTCEITLTFNPAGLGTSDATIDINYDDGLISSQNFEIDGTGSAVQPALLSFPAHDFGRLQEGLSSGTITLTMTNSGGVAAINIGNGEFSDPAFQMRGAGFPGTDGDCGTSLINGFTCELNLELQTTTAADYDGNQITLSYNNGAILTEVIVNLDGIVDPYGVLTISQGPTYDFGKVNSLGTLPLSFKLTNTGTGNANISSNGNSTPEFSDTGSFPGSGTCVPGADLPSGLTCTFDIDFTPGEVGNFADTFWISYDDTFGDVTTSIVVEGEGVMPAVLVALAPGNNYNFGLKANGSSTDYIFTISNSGGADATGIFLTPSLGAFGESNDCHGSSISGGSSCLVTLSFSPTGSGGHSATIDIDYNDGITIQDYGVGVSGTSAPPAVLSLSNHNFGRIKEGTTVPTILILNNTGGVSAEAIDLVSFSNSAFSFTGVAGYPGDGGASCGTSLSPGACSLQIQFDATNGDYINDYLELSYNDGVENQTITNDLDADADPFGVLTITDGPIFIFGQIDMDDSRTLPLGLTNSGTGNATIVSSGNSDPTFADAGGTFPGISGSCPSYLGLGIGSAGTCNFELEFNPGGTAGNFSDTYWIEYNDTFDSVTVTVVLDGEAIDSANITNVTSDFADATYNASTLGATIPIKVQFDTPVDVTGVPYIILETGATDTNAAYVGGSGTSDLIFNYTVTAGNINTDLEVQNSSIQLTGASIKNVGTSVNADPVLPVVVPDSLSANKDFYIDTVVPVISSVSFVLTTYNPIDQDGNSIPDSPDETPTLSAGSVNSADAMNGSLTIYSNFGCSGIAEGVVITGDNHTVVIDISSLPDNTNANDTLFYAKIFDAAGNTSACYNTAQKYQKRIFIEPIIGFGGPPEQSIWNKFVRNDDLTNYPAFDLLNYDDTANSWCALAEATSHPNRCLNSGLMFKVRTELPAASCSDYQAFDNQLGMRWACVNFGNGKASFVSTGFRPGKGLADFIDFQGFPVWKNVTLRIRDSLNNLDRTSTSRKIWNNGITTIESIACGIDCRTQAATDYQIYTLTSSLTTRALFLNNVGQSLILYGAGQVVGESGGPAWKCGPSADSYTCVVGMKNYFQYVEGGNINTGGLRPVGLHMDGAHFARVRNLRIGPNDTATGDTGIYVLNTEASRLEDITVADSSIAFDIYKSNRNYFQNFNIYNVFNGMWLNQSKDNVFVRGLITGSESVGIWIKNDVAGTGGNNTFSHISVIDTMFNGVYTESEQNTFSQINVMNVQGDYPSTGGGFGIQGPIADGNRFKNISTTDNWINFAFYGDIEGTTFDGYMNLGNPGSGDCYLDGGDANNNPGLTLAGGPVSGLGACHPVSNPVNINYGVTLINSYTGYVSDDTSHGGPNITTMTYTSMTDWFNFDNPFRFWKEDAPAMHDLSKFACEAGGPETCRIVEYIANITGNLFNSSNDGLMGGAPDEFPNLPGNSCPPAVDGNMTITNQNSTFPSTYLVNASEVIGDAAGDDDGLCESAENCVYTPHIGNYQGHGVPYSHTCSFTSGKVGGVSMYGFALTGLPGPTQNQGFANWTVQSSSSVFNFFESNSSVTITSHGVISKAYAGTFKTTGKYYFEVEISGGAQTGEIDVGIGLAGAINNGTYNNTALGFTPKNGSDDSVAYRSNDGKVSWQDPSTQTTSLVKFDSVGSIVGVAVDVDAGKIWFRNKFGNWQLSDPSTGADWSGNFTGGLSWAPVIGMRYSPGSVRANFGQRPFEYPVPVGFTPGWF